MSTDLHLIICHHFQAILQVLKVKSKVLPTTGHEGLEGEQRHSSSLSLTLALDGDGWSMPHPGCFTPGKEPLYPLYRRLGWNRGQSGWVQKISPTPRFDRQTIQPIASHYTNYTIPALKVKIYFISPKTIKNIFTVCTHKFN
jgi:hypothetical protein